MIGVVVPVTRPERIPGIGADFQAQTHSAKLLVLVLNGPARDATCDVPPGMIVLRVEGGTPARARNAGLDWLRVNGIELVAFWDDDDRYLPGYLAETVAALVATPDAVTGKCIRYVRFDDGLCCALGAQDGFLGGTIGGWVRSLPPIPDLPLNEDREWCFALRASGTRLIDLGGLHYVYNRRSGAHAWHANRAQLLRVFGPAFDFGAADDSVAATPLAGGLYTPRPSIEAVGKAMLEDLCRRTAAPPPTPGTLLS